MSLRRLQLVSLAATLSLMVACESGDPRNDNPKNGWIPVCKHVMGVE